MTVATLIGLLVPRPWSPAQARRAERRLQQAIDAIWYVHGEAMAAATLGPAAPAAAPPPHGRRARRRPRRTSPPIQRSFARLVPSGWSGDQALRVVHVLHLAIAAAWESCDEAPPPISGEPDEPLDEEDDIPF